MVKMTYTGHILYRVLAALCVLLVLLFVWQLFHGWDWGSLLFLGVAAWSAYRCYILMSSKIELTNDRVRVLAPGGAPREVEFRQFASVYAEGRALKSILLLYHPRDAIGLFDLDDVRTVVLPAVNQHEELLAALTAKVPQ
jgi:hypothetical protein